MAFFTNVRDWAGNVAEAVIDNYADHPHWYWGGGLTAAGLGAFALSQPQSPPIGPGVPVSANQVYDTQMHAQLDTLKPSPGGVYGDPLNSLERLNARVKIAKDLNKFPEDREKAMREVEVDAQLKALQAQILSQGD